MKNNFFLVLFLTFEFISVQAYGQKTDSTQRFSTSIYLEGYYGYDFGNPVSQNRPDFLYSFHRHNEPNINLSLIEFNYNHARIRSDLGVLFGTFSTRNYEIEPGILKNIYQAKIGFQLSSTRNSWMDIGIMESHIGFEGAKGMDCWTASRSLLAENTPYYSAGIQISHTTKDSTLYFAGLILNGWQRVTRKGFNQLPAVGHQFKWTPNDRITINSSSYIGNEYPEAERRMRYFHNFYTKYEKNQIGWIAGIDFGTEQLAYQSKNYGNWFSAVFVVKKNFGQHLSSALRGEYFYDKNGIIIPTEGEVPFKNIGISTNVDYTFNFPLTFRIEYRSFYNERNYYEWAQQPSSVNHYTGLHIISHF